MAAHGRRAPKTPHAPKNDYVVHESYCLVTTATRPSVSRQIIWSSGRTESFLLGTYATKQEATQALAQLQAA